MLKPQEHHFTGNLFEKKEKDYQALWKLFMENQRIANEYKERYGLNKSSGLRLPERARDHGETILHEHEKNY